MKARFFLVCAFAVAFGMAMAPNCGQAAQPADYEARLDEILNLCKEGQLEAAYQKFSVIRAETALPPAIDRFLVSLLLNRCAGKSEPQESSGSGLQLEFGLGYSSNLNRGPSAKGIFLGEPGNLAFLEFSQQLRPRPGWFSQLQAVQDTAGQGLVPNKLYGQLRHNGMPGSHSHDSKLELGADWWRESGEPSRALFQASRIRAHAIAWQGQGSQAGLEWLGIRPVEPGYLTLRSELRGSALATGTLEWLGELGFGLQRQAAWPEGRLEVFTALGLVTPAQGTRPGGQAWLATIGAQASGAWRVSPPILIQWSFSLAYQRETDSQSYSPNLVGSLKRNLRSRTATFEVQVDRPITLPALFPAGLSIKPGLSLQVAKTESAVDLFDVDNAEVILSMSVKF